jgi:alanyl aminopeptidase
MTPPAFRLGDAAAPIHYDARLAIDPRASTFTGEITIELAVKRAAPVLWLNATDLEIDTVVVTQEDRAVPVSILRGGEDFVGLRGAFAAGNARVRFAYRGKLDALAVDGLFRQRERGDWYALSQFQPLGARRAFPCFDEPGWKTPWRLTIDAPGENLVAANTPATSASAIADRPGWWRHEFAETRPLPSYLVALAVGPFDVLAGGTAGARRTPLRYLAPRGRGAEARYAAEVTPKLLASLEEYFAIPYPFGKLDSAPIPQLVTFGAMENVGLITYGSELFLAHPHEETPRFRESYAGIAAHEIAHMWFGNFATLAWWDDTWLNEAFASWVGSKVQYALDPAWDTGVSATKSRNQALFADRLASARSIAAPVETRNSIDDAFDDITYNKGEEVLAMFEAWIGPERFRKAVRSFLLAHAYGTATSADFFRAAGEASGDPDRVVGALKGFVNQPGAPLIDLALRCRDVGAPQIEVKQQRFRPRGSTMRELAWTTPACFSYSAGGKSVSECHEVSSRPADAGPQLIELGEASSCPAWIVGNAGGRGHYIVRYEPGLWLRIASRASAIPSHELQALVRDTLLQVDAGLLSIDLGLSMAESAFRHASPSVRLAVVDLMAGLRDEWLTPAQLKEKGRIVEQSMLPVARDLTWTPRAQDSDETVALRPALLRFVADRLEGAGLRAEARVLALRWIAEPSSVDATVAKEAVEVAGRFADSETFERLESAALAVESTRERLILLGALARVRDAKLRERALALSLAAEGGKPRLDGRSAFSLLNRALHDDENRAASLAYVVANLDAIEAKLPKDTPASLLAPMGHACAAAERTAIERAFAARAGRWMTGPLRYAQALESVELCIAAHR